MACKGGCGLDLDFVHDVFQIWRMEVLPIILILVNVMIIIVVLSSVWTITMISWSSSMLTIWSARKGMEAEGGFEKKDFFENIFRFPHLWLLPSNSVISSNFRSNILLFNIHQAENIFFNIHQLQNIFFNIHQAENIFFNIHQAQPTYLHDLVAQNGKAWMYSGWGWKPDSLATLWRNRCAKLQLYDSMKVLKYDHCIVFWYSQAVIDINFKEHWYGHIKPARNLIICVVLAKKSFTR